MKKLLLLGLFFYSMQSLAFETLFYLRASNKKEVSADIQDISLHKKSISILGPQVLTLEANGEIKGHIDSTLVTQANQDNIKLMPLVINDSFDQDLIHAFLHDAYAQKYAISQLIKLCKSFDLYGIQFDIENIHTDDKHAFTEFYRNAAQALHAEGFKISAAVVPRNDSEPNTTSFQKWYYDNWSGAYDYEKLAQYSDFISLMTYDRHTSLTTPGPIAPYHWTETILRNLLKSIPAEKISLGIPLYSGYWTTGMITIHEGPHRLSRFSFRAKESQISFATALEHLQGHTKVWDEKSKSFYSVWDNDGLYDYLFLEDAKSFEQRYALAKKYHLRGISLWKLTQEDPGIWQYFS